jgi:head-tail adaptor
MGEIITRQRAVMVPDAYNNTVPNWTSPAEITLTVRGVEPVSSIEESGGRQAVITGYRVYLDPGSDINAGDRAVMRGATYEVDGTPADWRSPFGSEIGGIVVTLKHIDA